MKEIKTEILNKYYTIFLVLSLCICTVIILFVSAIIFFPGGNLVYPNQDGFSFIHNTISDLGGLKTPSQGTNTVSFVLYTIGGVIMVIWGFFFYAIIWRFFQNKRITKILSTIGSSFGFLHASLYLGVMCAPVDTFTKTHNILIFSAPGALFIGILAYTIVFLIDKRIPKINTYSFVAMVAAAFFFATIVTIGSILGEPLFSLSRKTGHTVFIFVIFLIYLLQTIGFMIFFKRLTLDRENLRFKN